MPYRDCVGIMLYNERGLVFLGKRAKGNNILPFEKAWQMPQGGIEQGEDALLAAYRELLEETSISEHDVKKVAEIEDWLSYDLPANLVPNLWGGKYYGQRQKWFLFKFIGQNSQINVSTKFPEFSDWRWEAPENLVDVVVDFKADVYAEATRYFLPIIAKDINK